MLLRPSKFQHTNVTSMACILFSKTFFCFMRSFCHRLWSAGMVNVHRNPGWPSSDADYGEQVVSAILHFCTVPRQHGRLFMVWGPWVPWCQRTWPWIEFGDRTEGELVGQGDRGSWERKGNSSLQGSTSTSIWLHSRVKRSWARWSAPWSQLLRGDLRETRKARPGLAAQWDPIS